MIIIIFLCELSLSVQFKVFTLNDKNNLMLFLFISRKLMRKIALYYLFHINSITFYFRLQKIIF